MPPFLCLEQAQLRWQKEAVIKAHLVGENQEKGNILLLFFIQEKRWKKLKKTVDNPGSVWYYKQALDAGDKSLSWARFSKSKASLNERTKNHLTVRKKFLTSELRYGRLIKSPARAIDKGEARRADLRAEKVWKNFKKLLTRPKRCGKMNSRRCKAVCTL